MKMKSSLIWAALLISPLLMAGQCGVKPDGTPNTDKLNDGDPSAAQTAKACRDGRTPAVPYVTGMPGSMINSLRNSMQSSGLVAVNFTCDGLYIVPGCTPTDARLNRRRGYRFIKTAMIEDTRAFQGAAEVQGNFRNLAVSADVKAQQNFSMELKVRTVGSLTTNVNAVYKAQLDPFGCSEATHFVKKVQVGAFALSGESMRKLDASVQVTGAGGADINMDQAASKGLAAGDWKGCEDKTDPRDKGCGAPVQLTLLPIIDADPPIAPQPVSPTAPSQFCPPGQVLSNGSCIAKARALKEGGFTCDPSSRAQCQDQCDGAGNADSCNSFGEILESEGDIDGARERYKKGCEAKQPSLTACAHLASIILKVDKDVERALSRFKIACDGGDGLGCYGLGKMIRADDTQESSEKFKLACDAGFSAGCAAVGEGILEGLISWYGSLRAVESDDIDDLKQGIALVEEGCLGGSERGCYVLGTIYESGVPGRRASMVEATALFERACNGDEPDACMKLGEVYETGRQMEARQSLDKALGYFWRACYGDRREGNSLPDPNAEMADPDGCAELALLFGRRDDRERLLLLMPGTRDQYERITRDLLTRSCEQQSARGCLYLAEAYDGGLYGFGRDAANAVQGYTEACSQRESDACFKLGQWYEEGKGLTRDIEQALSKYHAACQIDRNPRACYQLAEGIFENCDIQKGLEACMGRFSTLVADQEKKASDQFNDEEFFISQLSPPQRFLLLVLKNYTRACQDAGYARACLDGGRRIMAEFKDRRRKSVMPETSAEIALAMFDSACNDFDEASRYEWYPEAAHRKDALEACMAAGEVFENGWGVPSSDSEAFFRYYAACEDFDGARGEARETRLSACAKVGDFYNKGRGVNKDVVRARNYLAEVCESQFKARRAALDALTSKDDDKGRRGGKGRAADENARLRAELPACVTAESIELEARQELCLRDSGQEFDKWESCVSTAEILEARKDRRSQAEAVRLFERACTFERRLSIEQIQEPVACYKVASARLSQPKLMLEDFDNNLKDLERACRADISQACYDLAQMHLKGYPVRGDKRVEKNIPKGIVLLNKACDDGDGVGCLELGTLLEKGDLGPDLKASKAERYQTAVMIYSSSCDSREGQACFRLGNFFMRGVPEVFFRDVERAKVYFERGCSAGHKPSCFALTNRKRGEDR